MYFPTKQNLHANCAEFSNAIYRTKIQSCLQANNMSPPTPLWEHLKKEPLPSWINPQNPAPALIPPQPTPASVVPQNQNALTSIAWWPVVYCGLPMIYQKKEETKKKRNDEKSIKKSTTRPRRMHQRPIPYLNPRLITDLPPKSKAKIPSSQTPPIRSPSSDLRPPRTRLPTPLSRNMSPPPRTPQTTLPHQRNPHPYLDSHYYSRAHQTENLL